MSDLNSFNIYGSVVRTEEKTTDNGVYVLSVCIANNETKKIEDNYEIYSNYFYFSLFNDYAKNKLKYLIQGTKVIVSGSVHQNRWKNDDGSTASNIQFKVSKLQVVRISKMNQDKSSEFEAEDSTELENISPNELY